MALQNVNEVLSQQPSAAPAQDQNPQTPPPAPPQNRTGGGAGQAPSNPNLPLHRQMGQGFDRLSGEIARSSQSTAAAFTAGIDRMVAAVNSARPAAIQPTQATPTPPTPARTAARPSENERQSAHEPLKGEQVALGAVVTIVAILFVICGLNGFPIILPSPGDGTSWARGTGEKDPSICFRSTNLGKDSNGVLMTPIEPIECE